MREKKPTETEQGEALRACVDAVELPLESVGLADAARLIDSATSSQVLGALAARLVELGSGSGPSLTDGESLHLYTTAMTHLRQRLDDDPVARQVVATHPRTYGRPAHHLATAADEWVAPLAMAEIERLPDGDRPAFCRMLMTTIGHQHGVHPDFRPLLVKMATSRPMIDHLTSACGDELAGAAASFVDVVMQDAADGTELEAAVWSDARRRIEGAAGQDLILYQVTQNAASLLALVDNSRSKNARRSQAQAHAGQATKTAVAEFVFTGLMGLAKAPGASRIAKGLDIGAFVRRDTAGWAPVELPKAIFESWARRQTAQTLLGHLVLLLLLGTADDRATLSGQALSVPSAGSPEDMGAILEHLEASADHPSAALALRAVDSGWHDAVWAGAA